MDELIPWLHQQLDDAETDARYNEGMSVDAGWNPDRVLAVVQAHRRILELHTGEHECSTIVHRQGVPDVDSFSYVLETELCSTVLLLASTLDHQPGYQERWRP